MKVAQSHGIDIPRITMDVATDDRYLDLVSVHYNGRDEIDDVSLVEDNCLDTTPLFSRTSVHPMRFE
jgi:hypothetical protein